MGHLAVGEEGLADVAHGGGSALPQDLENLQLPIRRTIR